MDCFCWCVGVETGIQVRISGRFVRFGGKTMKHFANDTGFYGSEMLREKSKLFCNFWSGTFACETFAARSLWGEESFFTGLVGYGGVIAYCLLSNGNKQEHPSHDTQSDTQKYRKKVGDATSGGLRSQSKQGISQSHPLWHKLWTQTLSAYVVYTVGPS